jgi:hypothetical protein
MRLQFFKLPKNWSKIAHFYGTMNVILEGCSHIPVFRRMGPWNHYSVTALLVFTHILIYLFNDVSNSF